ncbi:hypothetical protein [Actinomadura algeriensis]|uniref:Uncharacterized protein n=1 Tax=Actinomadura algeriensis TaxID=1679523 RepID=A0ABR9JMZ8_9ACTN|nr:hypothetical protein [Actinomadura algeriensis]MBE1531938.1 hypothetical protein [Actinomadura algeriensis]
MSRDAHPGTQCPHCRSHLALVPLPAKADTAPTPTAPAPTALPIVPIVPVAPKEEWQPPPVSEVLADYAGRAVDTATATRGAAKVRESLNRARAVAAQRRAAQKTARHRTRNTTAAPKSA